MKAIRNLFLFAGLIGLTLISCEKNEKQSTLNLRDSLIIQTGELLENEELNLSITMDSVIQDSRCPLIADCIWEGNAVVKFDVKYAGDHYQVFINTASDYVHDTVIDIYRIELLELNPMRETFEPIDQKQYSSKIVVIPLKLRL
jgi:hypothetical protein